MLSFPLPLLPFFSLPSDDRAVRDDAVLGDDDDAVAYVPASVGGHVVRSAALVDEADARADARVLVDDGVAYDRALADAHARLAVARVAVHVLDGLVEVRAHDVRVLDVRAEVYARADAD